MAKKSSLKVRLVPEEKPDSKYYYYAKKPTAGEKAKEKLKMKEMKSPYRRRKFYGLTNLLQVLETV